MGQVQLSDCSSTNIRRSIFQAIDGITEGKFEKGRYWGFSISLEKNDKNPKIIGYHSARSSIQKTNVVGNGIHS